VIKTADGVEIKVGDIVWMTIGGAPMAVVRIGTVSEDGSIPPERTEVECAWFTEQGYLSTALLPGIVLISAPPKP
jgi:uncharacterized protein YodC (DUF2158 family)